MSESSIDNYVLESNGAGYTLVGVKDQNVTELVIPEEVTAISSAVFFGNSSIESVRIPAGCAYIGPGAFADCRSLKAVYFDGTLEQWLKCGAGQCFELDGHDNTHYDLYIGGELLTEAVISDNFPVVPPCAFINCRSLQSLKLSENTFIISDLAFYGTENLKAVSITQSVVEIRYCAFMQSGLVDLTICDSVWHIGNYAFSQCESLIHVSLPEDLNINDTVFSESGDQRALNLWWGEDGALVDADTGLIEYGAWLVGADKGLTDVAIPSNCVKIAPCALSGCADLEHVTLLNPDTEIDRYAFMGARKLKKVDALGEVIDMSNFVIEDALSTDDFYFIPDGKGGKILSKVKDRNIVEAIIPEDVTEIADFAFYCCGDLKHVSIPDSVNTISHLAFEECINLSADVFPYFSESSYYDPFYNEVIYTKVILHSYDIDDWGIREAVIPPWIEEIEDFAFSYCEDLERVTILNKDTVLARAFFGCTKLKKISVLGEKVEINTMAPVFSGGEIDGCTFDSNGQGGCIATAVDYHPDALVEDKDRYYGKEFLDAALVPAFITKVADLACEPIVDLTGLIICGKETEISDKAFGDDIPEILIEAPAGSKAEEFAKKHGIRFQVKTW